MSYFKDWEKGKILHMPVGEGLKEEEKRRNEGTLKRGSNRKGNLVINTISDTLYILIARVGEKKRKRLALFFSILRQ